jgi:hypothetical protein
LLEEEYQKAQRLSLAIAAMIEPPRFYIEKRNEVETSRWRLENHPMAAEAIAIVEEGGDRLGHGLSHARKVAIDAGALVIVEISGHDEAEILNAMLLAQIAGILHDIRRDEPDHAEKGAAEAMRLLAGFDLDEKSRQTVAMAIRNHEAFRPMSAFEDPLQQLVSDALYDADKFRWGPDNFTETVWSMLARPTVPLSVVMEHFPPSMKGIERITDTFRTETGRRYGPDFIARGLEIGNRLYSELSRETEKDE